MKSIRAVLRRELLLLRARGSEWTQPLFYALIVVVLFALGAEAGDRELRRFAPAVIWLAALLSPLLVAERLFREEIESGALEQVRLSGMPLSLWVALKVAVAWVVSGLPLAVFAPLLGKALGLPGASNGALMLALLLGTPVLMLLTALAGALTAALPRAGALTPLLILPLAAPVMVFGAGAIRLQQQGLDPGAALYFVAALLVLSVTLLPLAIAAALRLSSE